jgi:hypothetical protein
MPGDGAEPDSVAVPARSGADSQGHGAGQSEEALMDLLAAEIQASQQLRAQMVKEA